MNAHEAWARRAAEHGYRPVAGRPCPRVVAGRDCRASRGGLVPRCVCADGGDGRWIYDQPRLWRDEITGELVLTSEPYRLPADVLAEWLQRLDGLDLDVSLSGESWYDPGQTFRITISRRGHRSRRWAQCREVPTLRTVVPPWPTTAARQRTARRASGPGYVPGHSPGSWPGP